MKIIATSHLFPYAWDYVSAAHWQKYPNPWARHVVHVDILNDTVDQNGRLVRERLIVCRQNIPSFITKMFGGDDITYAYEVSITDPNRQRFISRSVNLSFSEWLRVEETCRYTPDPKASAEQTMFSQEAKIVASSRFANLLEELSLKRFCENATRGKQGFEQVLERFISESQELASKVAM